MTGLITIEELLEAKEGEQIQFKEAKNRFNMNEAVQCCCALSNCGGGKLVFGITDKRPRKVVGNAAFSQPERTRKGLIDKLKVMVDFQVLDCDGKRVLISVSLRVMTVCGNSSICATTSNTIKRGSLFTTFRLLMSGWFVPPRQKRTVDKMPPDVGK